MRARALAGLALAWLAVAAGAQASSARERTVYFNAWGGDPAINRYIAWAGEQVRARHGITLEHVKVTDISEAVQRLKAERAAGRDSAGSMDLLWINGENFAALKRADLLHGPWARDVPNAELVDWQSPTIRRDGNIATDGYELPWGSVALTFFYWRDSVPAVPRNPDTLLAWIEAHPGRFTYVQPPDFVGTAFLKQMLALLVNDAARLQHPVGDDFDAVSAPLWRWLDRAHAASWRRGRLFPLSGPAQRELLAVGEIDWMLAYNPAAASRAIANHELPDNIGAMHMDGGALGNSHFLAIPYNAAARDAATQVASFLLSPQAQARKADERVWGDTTVLVPARLSPAQRALFDDAGARGRATPPPPDRTLAEPHPSWTEALERTWQARYTR